MGANDSLRAAAVAGLLLTGFPSAFAQNWTLTSAPITNWSSIAMSADGKKITAVSGSDNSTGLIYFSTNAGATWALADAPSQYWSTVATSADGTRWIAAGYYGSAYSSNGVFLSTNGAANWNFAWLTDTNNNWSCVRSSADGETLAVADYGMGRVVRSLLFTSTNAGNTWALSVELFTNRITSLAASADGLNWLLAGDWFGATVLASSDRTCTWVETDAPEIPWSCSALSADGWKGVAAARYSGIYVSINQGMNWTATSTPMANWKGLASSADGTKLVAVRENGYIYTSANSGVDWIPADAPSANWTSVTSSADGCKLAATVAGGGIYTWQTTPSPQLNITPGAGGLLISWIVPSMPFVLQENFDLASSDWIDVPTAPTLNFTNLHNEVTVPPFTTNRFYRLKLTETANQ